MEYYYVCFILFYFILFSFSFVFWIAFQVEYKNEMVSSEQIYYFVYFSAIAQVWIILQNKLYLTQLFQHIDSMKEILHYTIHRNKDTNAHRWQALMCVRRHLWL